MNTTTFDPIQSLWNHLESPYPGWAADGSLWAWYFKHYFSYDNLDVTSSAGEYWENIATEMLLILCSEGETIE